MIPIRDEGSTSEGLYREALVLALPERHPLTAKATIEIADLHELPLVTMRGDIEPRFDEDLNRLFAVARVQPRLFHEATTPAEALELGSERDVAVLTMPSAQYPTRIVFRRPVDELLAARRVSRASKNKDIKSISLEKICALGHVGPSYAELAL